VVVSATSQKCVRLHEIRKSYVKWDRTKVLSNNQPAGGRRQWLQEEVTPSGWKQCPEMDSSYSGSNNGIAVVNMCWPCKKEEIQSATTRKQ